MDRTTQDVLTHHLTCFGKGDLGGMMADYTPSSRFFTPNGVLRGTGAIRELFSGLVPGGGWLMLRDSRGGGGYIMLRNILVSIVLLCGAGCARPDWIEQTLVTVDVTGRWTGKWFGSSGVGGGETSE